MSRTLPLAIATSDSISRTFASKVAGSSRAIIWPAFTSVLKSAESCLIWPEICVPTSTVMSALRVPLAVTVLEIVPFSTFAVR